MSVSLYEWNQSSSGGSSVTHKAFVIMLEILNCIFSLHSIRLIFDMPAPFWWLLLSLLCNVAIVEVFDQLTLVCIVCDNVANIGCSLIDCSQLCRGLFFSSNKAFCMFIIGLEFVKIVCMTILILVKCYIFIFLIFCGNYIGIFFFLWFIMLMYRISIFIVSRIYLKGEIEFRLTGWTVLSWPICFSFVC